MRFKVVLEPSDEGGFTVYVPALPGCLSQGKTREEAIANIKEAIEGWLEVMESRSQTSATQLIEVTV